MKLERDWMKRTLGSRLVLIPAVKSSSSCGGTSASAIPLDSCSTGQCGGQWPPVATTRLSTMCRSVTKVTKLSKIVINFSCLL